MRVSLRNTVILPVEYNDDYVHPLAPKSDTDVIYYALDLSNRIMDGDTIISATAVVNDPSLVISNISIDSSISTVYFMVSAGMPNQVSILWINTKTQNGESRLTALANSNISPTLPLQYNYGGMG